MICPVGNAGTAAQKRSEGALDMIGSEVRERLGPPPELDAWPLVSIIVLHRDGVELLRRLLAGLVKRTDYPALELILIDNGSSDGSLDFMRRVEAPFPISILANAHNESFSDACNQGAELASGELLLFLNNDVEPFEPGWLRELVACLRGSGAGAVSATMITPDAAAGYPVQTRQIRIRGSGDDIGIDGGVRRNLFDPGFGEDAESAVAIGASVLIDPELFRRVGGYTHGFVYGNEDIDLFFKLQAQGLEFVYSGRSIAIHRPRSTREKLLTDDSGAQSRNSRLLVELWGARVWREYHLARLSGGGRWAAPEACDASAPPTLEEVLALGFCLVTDGTAGAAGAALGALEAALRRRGHRCLRLTGDASDDRRGLFYDVAVHIRGRARFVPKPGRLNVLWIPDELEAVTGIECRRYDMAATPQAASAVQLRRDSGTTPVRALDPERPADDLIDAVLARADEIGHPLRINPMGERSEPVPL